MKDSRKNDELNEKKFFWVCDLRFSSDVVCLSITIQE